MEKGFTKLGEGFFFCVDGIFQVKHFLSEKLKSFSRTHSAPLCVKLLTSAVGCAFSVAIYSQGSRSLTVLLVSSVLYKLVAFCCLFNSQSKNIFLSPGTPFQTLY